jgi:IclR family acetate operon transcriptional repressor
VSTPPPVRTSDRLVTVIESFLTTPHQTLSEVAAACAMDPSTAMRYLRQLVQRGWLERDDRQRTYCLGVRLIELGHAAQLSRGLRPILLAHMRELVARFDETVNLAVHRGSDIVIIEAVESGRSIRRGATVGDRDQWFASSLGKSILAHMDEQDVLALLQTHRPPRHTANTLVTDEEILADLELVRERGYAVDDEEAELGLKCVGVPIRDYDGRWSHAMSMSGPTVRMNERLDEIIDAMCIVSRTVGRKTLEEVS